MTRWILLTTLLTGLWLPASAQDIAKLRNFVREPDSLVKKAFGAPDEVSYRDSKQAVVWTYFLSRPDGPAPGEGNLASKTDSLPSGVSALSLQPVNEGRVGAGYRQFAFWNGKVAAVSLLRTGTEADPLYDAGLSYLKANANWVGHTFVADSSRTTRIGDDILVIGKQSDGNDTQAAIRIGDAGYMLCDKARQSELQRVKAEFGVDPE